MKRADESCLNLGNATNRTCIRSLFLPSKLWNCLRILASILVPEIIGSINFLPYNRPSLIRIFVIIELSLFYHNNEIFLFFFLRITEFSSKNVIKSTSDISLSFFPLRFDSGRKKKNSSSRKLADSIEKPAWTFSFNGSESNGCGLIIFQIVIAPRLPPSAAIAYQSPRKCLPRQVYLIRLIRRIKRTATFPRPLPDNSNLGIVKYSWPVIKRKTSRLPFLSIIFLLGN